MMPARLRIWTLDFPRRQWIIKSDKCWPNAFRPCPPSARLSWWISISWNPDFERWPGKIFCHSKMNRTEIILRDLESVLSKLEAALNAPKSDLTRDSAILRFERAFQLGCITDEVLWQQLLLQRNAAVHIYREPLAEVLYNQLRSFLDGFKELLKNLKEKRKAFRTVR